MRERLPDLITYKDDGTFWYFTPGSERDIMAFIDAVHARAVLGPMMWGLPKNTDEKIYEIAKEEYKDFKDILPESIVDSYNPSKKCQQLEIT